MFKLFLQELITLISIAFHPIRLVKSIKPFKTILNYKKYGAINTQLNWKRFIDIWEGTRYGKYLEQFDFDLDYWSFICDEVMED